jgi:hypothetical protein
MKQPLLPGFVQPEMPAMTCRAPPEAVPASSAASANAAQLTIKPDIFLLDHLSQAILLGVKLVGARNIVLACW